MKRYFLTLIVLISSFNFLFAQEIGVTLDESSTLEQIYGDHTESSSLLPMGDLDIEFGYVLYATEVDMSAEKDVLLAIENVRDYASIYVNKKYVGSLNNETHALTLNLSEGKSVIQIYVENIGRITYGPEILDNSKGLFGKATLDGSVITSWQLIPLYVRECEVEKLTFTKGLKNSNPAFFKGSFTIEQLRSGYLDTMGWGMGEVWINGQYLGAYWEEESQKSIPIPQSILKLGKNELVIFDLKNNQTSTARITNEPVFD